MPTQTAQRPVYKICTKNCFHYRLYRKEDGCEKGNWAFSPPLGERCTFSLLEGQMEKSLPFKSTAEQYSPGPVPTAGNLEFS